MHFWLFMNRLKTIEAENTKNLRTASLNSEFTGSNKKVFCFVFQVYHLR